jgi:hypothetical protein
MRSTSSFFGIVFVQKQIVAFDQHAHATADVAAQHADLREAAQDLQPCIDPEKNSFRGGGVAG